MPPTIIHAWTPHPPEPLSHRLASASIVHHRMGISTSFSASPATISRIWLVMTDGVRGMLSLLIPASFSHPRLGQSLGVQKLWQRRQSSLHVARRSDDPSGRCYPSWEPIDHLRSFMHHVMLNLVGDGEGTVVGLLIVNHSHHERQPGRANGVVSTYNRAPCRLHLEHVASRTHPEGVRQAVAVDRNKDLCHQHQSRVMSMSQCPGSASREPKWVPGLTSTVEILATWSWKGMLLSNSTSS